MEDNNLKVFYSCLVLVCALRPPKPDHIRTAQPDAAWCRFLNDLCWFCDTATGGKTVVSITTQHLRNSSRFWLACNSDTTGPLKSLKWLLSKLNNAHLLSESQLNHLETEIISESVRISHKKLKYHARRLQFCLEQVADARGNENACSLEQSICRLLEDNRAYHVRLSSETYAFRKNVMYAALKRRASGESALALQWTAIRHHIGRLASWTKSAKACVRMAQDKRVQSILKTADSRAVPQPRISPSTIIEHDEQYHDMLGQVFSDLDPNMLRDRFETCTRGDVHVSNLMEHMHEKRPQPALHAEMRLIEHTVAWGRRATMNQYIACSKPPCYCCALYARLRRYDIRMRPGHGNAYVKWALPFFQNESSFQRQQRGDQNDVLSKMIKEMRYTVQEQLIKGLHRGFYRPDSATDISTTLPSMRNPLPTGTQLEIPSHQKNSQ